VAALAALAFLGQEATREALYQSKLVVALARHIPLPKGLTMTRPDFITPAVRWYLIWRSPRTTIPKSVRLVSRYFNQNQERRTR
jgi:hypothetical protein